MRLIDADALKELFPDNGEGSWTYNITARMYIDNAPTVWDVWKDGSLPRAYCPNCGAKMKMAINLCDDCKFSEDCNPTIKNRDGVSTTQCSKYEQYEKGAEE